MGRSVYYLHYLTFLRIVVYSGVQPLRTLDLFDPLVPLSVPSRSLLAPILGDGIQKKLEGLRNLSLSNLLLCSPFLYLHYNIFQWKLSTKNKRLKVLETSPRAWKARMLTITPQPHMG